MHIKVFISYSHDSEAHMQRVLNLSDQLRSNGIDCEIDQYEMSPSSGWTQWMLSQVEHADFVLVVCTKAYAVRFKGEAPKGQGLGAKWEGAVITQQLYDAERNTNKFIPIIVDDDDTKYIPIPLRGFQYYSPFTDDQYWALYRLLTNQPEVVKPELGAEVESLPLKLRRTKFEPADAGSVNAQGEGKGVEDTQPPGPGDDSGSGGTPSPSEYMKWLIVALAVVTLLVVVVFKDKIFSRDEDENSDPMPTQPVFEGTYFPKMPFYLKHTMNNDDSLYWLLLEGRNPTAELLHVDVHCTILNEPKFAECGRATSFTLQPGESISKIVDPRLEILAPDSFKTPFDLDITWTVKDDKDNIRWQGTHDIEVEPKTQFHWPLVNSKGKEVDSEFLIASLSAWALTNHTDDAYVLGESLVEQSTSLTDFIRHVYDDVLTNPERVKAVFPRVRKVPPDHFIELRMPKHILRDQAEIYPFEAAVLLGAIAQKATAAFDGRVVTVLDKPGDDERRKVMIAWKETGTEWKSIDLTNLWMTFDDNIVEATRELDTVWFKDLAAPSIVKRGVYLDLGELRMALDFQRAREVFSIEPLP